MYQANKKLVANEMTIEETAKINALNIKNRIAIIDNKIALIELNGLQNVNTEDLKFFIGLTF